MEFWVYQFSFDGGITWSCTVSQSENQIAKQCILELNEYNVEAYLIGYQSIAEIPFDIMHNVYNYLNNVL